MDTTNCVACGKTATVWTGHITHFRRIIGAGWCSDGCIDRRRGTRGPRGFCGEWGPSIGLTRGRGRLATTTACDCGPSCAVWRIDHPTRS